MKVSGGVYHLKGFECNKHIATAISFTIPTQIGSNIRIKLKVLSEHRKLEKL